MLYEQTSIIMIFINLKNSVSCVKKNVASTYIGIFTNLENLATGPGDVLLQVPKTSPLRG